MLLASQHNVLVSHCPLGFADDLRYPDVVETTTESEVHAGEVEDVDVLFYGIVVQQDWLLAWWLVQSVAGISPVCSRGVH
jgi:hypothetical protein